MHSLITSYLLQSKECILPGIGILKIIHTPASTDSTNSRILPPFEGIIFKKEDHSASPGLSKYIAGKKHIATDEAEEELDSFCKEWKEKINAGEKLSFEAVGTIQKDAEGMMSFERDTHFDFLQPIPVSNNYIRPEKPAPIEKVLDFPEAKELKQDVVIERSYWGLWALILLAVASVMLFYHFKDHRLSRSTMGNQHRFIIDSAAAAYQIQK